MKDERIADWHGNAPTQQPTARRDTGNMRLPKYTVLSHFGHFDAMFRVNKEQEWSSVACLQTHLRGTVVMVVLVRMRMMGETRRSHPPVAPSASFA